MKFKSNDKILFNWFPNWRLANMSSSAFMAVVCILFSNSVIMWCLGLLGIQLVGMHFHILSIFFKLEIRYFFCCLFSCEGSKSKRSFDYFKYVEYSHRVDGLIFSGLWLWSKCDKCIWGSATGYLWCAVALVFSDAPKSTVAYVESITEAHPFKGNCLDHVLICAFQTSMDTSDDAFFVSVHLFWIWFPFII